LELREEVRQLARPLADESGYELVDVELASQGRERILRVLLDKPGGITVGDCALFSRRLADCLDMNQTVPGPYRLEVSSPGLARPLTSPEATRRFAGQRAAIALHAPRDEQRHFEGELMNPEGDRVGLRIDGGNEIWFDWTEVRSARLVVDPLAALRKPSNGASPGRRPRGGSR
jgi:ribosome maturation factor RimP